MAHPAWPAELPLPIGFLGDLGSPSLGPGLSETAMDDGPDRVRRRQIWRQTPRTIVLLLTRAQFVIFHAFVVTTLNGGAARFTVAVRQPDGTLGQRTVRIKGGLSGISEMDLGPRSRVAFTLLVENW